MSSPSPAPSRGKRQKTLRVFLVFGTLASIGTVVLLSLAAMEASSRLQEMTNQVRIDAEAAKRATDFGRVVLTQRRDDLLWHETGDTAILLRSQEDLRTADRLLPQLHGTITTPEENSVVEAVETSFESFREVAQEDRHRSPLEVTPRAERLMENIARLSEINERQMDRTNEASAELNRRIDSATLAILLLFPLFTVAGVWWFWARIFRTAVFLVRASEEFGSGNIAVRVPIVSDDEMGEVARTFNAMADEISARERERLDFIAMVAHDLRNPLSAIGGSALLLRKRGLTDPARHVEWVDRIIGQVRRIEAMTLDLTNAVQIQTGRLVLDIRPIDLTALLRGMVEEAKLVMPSGRTLRLDVLAECLILGDEARLERVMANLISNALKYGRPESEVHVEIASRGGEAIIRVTDLGVGIPPEDLPNLFQPFRRARGSAGAVRGIGLGLFSAKRIVEAHGGRIEIRSQVGVGTAVEIAIPIVDVSSHSGADPPLSR